MMRICRSIAIVLLLEGLLWYVAAQEDETCSADGTSCGVDEKPKPPPKGESIAEVMILNQKEKAENNRLEMELVSKNIAEIKRHMPYITQKWVDDVKEILPNPRTITEDDEARERWEEARKVLVKVDEFQQDLDELNLEEAMELSNFVSVLTELKQKMEKSGCFQDSAMVCDTTPYARSVDRLQKKVLDIEALEQKMKQMELKHHQLKRDGSLEKQLDLLPGIVHETKDSLKAAQELQAFNEGSFEILAKNSEILGEKRKEIAILKSNKEMAEKELGILDKTINMLENRQKEIQETVNTLRKAQDNDQNKMIEGGKAYFAAVDAENEKEKARIKDHQQKTTDELVQGLADAKNKLARDLTAAEDYLANMNTTETNTHFIFLLDKSGSMSGYRWNALVAAYDRFILTRLQKSRDDQVTIITFHHQAHVDLSRKPINDNVKITATDSGGTNYLPAFQKALEESQKSNLRTVMVFMTDGYASDIAPAAKIAGQIYNDRKDKGGVLTFVVALEAGLSTSTLEPIVKAGNGGAKEYDCRGEKLPLQMQVTAGNIAEVFAKIASTADESEQMMKDKIDRIQKVKQKNTDRIKESGNVIKELDVMYAMQDAKQETLTQRLKNAKKTSMEEMKKLVDSQIAAKEAYFKDIEIKLNETKAIKLQTTKKVALHTEDIRSHEEALQKRIGSNITQMHEDEIRKNMALESKEMENLIKHKEDWIKKTGYTKQEDVWKLRKSMRIHKDALTNQGKALKFVNVFVRQLKDYTKDIVETLEATQSTTAYLPASSKFDYVVQHFRDFYGIEDIIDDTKAAEKLHVILMHLAKSLGLGKPETIVDAIIQMIHNAEDLAQLTPEQLEKRLRDDDPDPSMKWKTMLSDGLGGITLQADVNKAKRAVKTVKEDIEKTEEKLQDESLTDRKSESLKDKLDSLQEKLEDKEQELRDAKEEIAEALDEKLSPAKTLLRHFVGEFNRALKVTAVKFQKETLKLDFESFQAVLAPSVAEYGNALSEPTEKVSMKPLLEYKGDGAKDGIKKIER
jgi:uncharacterized protein YegL